jgi:murein DD-endopeptidase MepM/ murein hydrolase activator NlpD
VPYQWQPTESAFSRLGFDPTGVRQSDPSGGFSGDPTGVRQDIKGFGGQDPLLDYGMSAFAEQLAKDQAAQQQFNGFWGNQAPQMGGQGMATIGGDWAGVDQWSSQIQAAASKYGVPANLIKAVMKLESGGDPSSVSVAGATGLMQIMPFWNGTNGLSIYDPNQNIELGAYILKNNYDQYGQSWEQAVRHYLGIGQDAYGTTDSMYWNRIQEDWNALNNATAGGTAGMGMGTGAGGSYGGLTSMLPAAPISYEFGVQSGLGYYEYGTQYGLNGTQHTGLDIAVPRNTAYRSPGAGTVMCAGTNIGSGADGSSCAAFADSDGGSAPGSGRVEVLLDNGVVLIFGHSASAALRPGARVNAGDIVGYSGGMNGAHVHLEARVRDASMPSGWRIVDPRQVLGSYAPAGTGYQSAPIGAPAQSGGGSMMEQMWRFLTQPGAKW